MSPSAPSTLDGDRPTPILGLLTAGTLLVSLYVGSQVSLLVAQVKSIDDRVRAVEGILMTPQARRARYAD